MWQWHQDDVNTFNGPLMFIPGSHKTGDIGARHDLTATSYPQWTEDHALIKQLVARAVSNHIRRPKRPAYIAHRDFTPIACPPGDCLLQDDAVDLPWAHGLPASALSTSDPPFDHIEVTA